MSREDDPGTGLRDVYETLARAPPQRLQSLTIQLGESPEDTVVQALCLLLLRKEAQALSKLERLEDNSLACHLAERWRAGGGGGGGEDLAEHCGRFRALTGESLASLARVFQVLSRQRLCEPRVRDLAYKRALSSECQRTSTYDRACYDRFREEARNVCGPELDEWTRWPDEPEPSSSSSSDGALDARMTALRVAGPPTRHASARCLPGPLQACPSAPSFPSHLEMSIPPTLLLRGDSLPPEASGDAGSAPPTLVLRKEEEEEEEEANRTPEPPPSARSQPESGARSGAGPGDASAAAPRASTSDPTSLKSDLARPSAAASVFQNAASNPSDDADEEEEDVFYAFAVLHAPEDAEAAESMRDKLEAVADCRGATFNGDFAVPGRSTLRCVEDAINNSAFTVLLLTRNFNSRMLSVKTNAALMNAIHHEHKYNTVIPLLPRENPMPKDGVPLVLRSIMPLSEDKNFGAKIRKLLSAARIERLRRKWAEGRRAEARRPRPPEREREPAPPDGGGGGGNGGGDGRTWRPQASSICIQNANYVMIGNQSRMTVGLGETSDQGGRQ